MLDHPYWRCCRSPKLQPKGVTCQYSVTEVKPHRECLRQTSLIQTLITGPSHRWRSQKNTASITWFQLDGMDYWQTYDPTAKVMWSKLRKMQLYTRRNRPKPGLEPAPKALIPARGVLKWDSPQVQQTMLPHSFHGNDQPFQILFLFLYPI